MKHSALRHPGLWELAVLSVLRERPMHPYEIQRLLRERHKDDVLVLKRGSLYHAIARLEAAALIEFKEATREGRRPERTTYRITRAGQAAQAAWLREKISAPRRERSDFMGALSFLIYLSPGEAAGELEQRVGKLEKEVAELDATLETVGPRIGRINVIETEYARAMRAAELHWTRALAADVRAHRLDWNLAALLRQIRVPAPRVRHEPSATR